MTQEINILGWTYFWFLNIWRGLGLRKIKGENQWIGKNKISSIPWPSQTKLDISTLYWQMDAFTCHLFCPVFPGDQKKKKNLDSKILTPDHYIVSVECNLNCQSESPTLYVPTNRHTSTSKPKVVTPESMRLSISSSPYPRVPGAGLNRQHHVAIDASYKMVLGKAPKVGRSKT